MPLPPVVYKRKDPIEKPVIQFGQRIDPKAPKIVRQATLTNQPPFLALPAPTATSKVPDFNRLKDLSQPKPIREDPNVKPEQAQPKKKRMSRK